jgi:hypothetical protein
MSPAEPDPYMRLLSPGSTEPLSILPRSQLSRVGKSPEEKEDEGDESWSSPLVVVVVHKMHK